MDILYYMKVFLFVLYCTYIVRIVPVKKYLWNIIMAILGNSSDDLSPHGDFKEGWISVTGVPTHVLTWGGWIEDPLPGGCPILLFMCGCPGITLFYHSFLEALHTMLNIPVWTINIAGHEIPPPSTSLVLTESPEPFNNVHFQIAHKIAFVRDYVPKNNKVFLVGHSFGAKMVVELLKEEQVRSQVEKSILLMPTVEKFKDTPRAKHWQKILKTGIIHLLVLSIWLLSLLPHALRLLFARIYFISRGVYNVPQCYLDGFVTFIHPSVFRNAKNLALDELNVIKDLDTEVFMNQRDRMKVYFAPDDQWAPLTHYDSLKSQVPGLAVEVLDNRFTHAFTLSTATEMADILDNDLRHSTTS